MQSAEVSGVIRNRIGRSRAFTARCILVLLGPPFVRPSPGCLLGSTGVRMDFDAGGVNHEPFKVRIIDNGLKYFFPNAFILPVAKASMGVFPISITRRQVSPWSPCA